MVKRQVKGKVSDKKKQNLTTDAVIYIVATFNNTHITITDGKEVLAKCSGGAAGFKGSRKSTPFAGQEAATKALEMLKNKNITLSNATIYVKGPDTARDSAARALLVAGIRSNGMYDRTPNPHNGPRAPKQRRI